MKPHPFVVNPVLFVDFIRRVSDDQIHKVLESFGLDASVTLIQPKRKRNFYRVDFADVLSAEKAFALIHLQPIPVVEPPVVLQFSVWPPTRPNVPRVYEPTASPRLVKPWVEGDTAGALFDALRRYGAIHSIHVDSTSGALVQFWSEDEASEAERQFVGVGTRKSTLQVYDPCSVFCANVNYDVDLPTLRSYFEKYGTITSAELFRYPSTGKSRGLATISFVLPEQASAAIKGMHEHEIHWRKIFVSYAIVKRSSTAKSFAPVAAPVAVDEQPPIIEPAAVPVVDCERCTQLEGLKGLYEALRDELSQHVEQDRDHRERHVSERANLQNRYDEEIKARHAAEDEVVEISKRFLAEMESSAALQAELERLRREVLQQRADHVKLQARYDKDQAAAKDDQTRLQAELEDAKEQLRREQGVQQRAASLAALRTELENAERAKLQEKYDKEVQQRVAATEEAEKLRVQKEAAERTLELVQSKLKMLELERDRPIWEEAKRKREAAEAEKRRAEEIETKRRNMEKMRAAEKARQEAERQEQLKREKEERERKERERKEREERERLAREREERERKLRAERELVQRLERWRVATADEEKRCKARDADLRRGFIIWTPARALKRVQLVMDEFDKLKFSETLPLTLGAIPWPVLVDPVKMKVEDISWDAVEAFCRQAKLALLHDQAGYKALVVSLHRMFHPDKWRSRAILPTVLDDELRSAVEAAGNSVAQALTPLWRETKGYT
ncbi:Polyadenylate-binding protein 1 [Mycena chlorophos]|uniref:Polyadenylate-binding protein 1 n=1 Tax=Mycena chlorophos TaxID=658473 RepID=A0A8H6TV69_MYCCL|nr:Polyadenylate-binding protein 1 [Mycena chlorophos]